MEPTFTPDFYIPQIKMTLTFDKKVKKSELFEVKSSREMAKVCRKVFNSDTFDWTEEFIVLCLNKRNVVVGFYKVGAGGITGVVADPKVVFTVALNCAATSIVVAHNHPSGNLKPSRADEMVTEKLKAAGKLLDIALLDHIIIGDMDESEGYYSFADEGLI